MGEQKKKGYPLGFYISCIAYSFERFAFYGSKPLLVLFLIRAVTEGGLGMNAADAATRDDYRSLHWYRSV